MLIQIDADDYDPLIARDVAQTTAEVFVEDTKVLMQDQDAADRVEVSIRDYALPGQLHKPKWKVNVLAGAVLGALVGVVIVFVLRFLEADIIHNARELEEYTGVAVLGLVPASGTASGETWRPQTARLTEEEVDMSDPIKLITLQEPSSAVSEAYRTLRMNLQYATLDRSLRTLLMTSPGPDEGKSTTLSNLAVTMAQVERRVIMVDCDLRRPRLHEIFGLENKSGSPP